MAQMIPARMNTFNNSTAECNIFDWFASDRDTKDWYVFHSLTLAKHPKFPIGESDFVVLAPNLGIFVLEVKGGEVFCKNREWHFINKYGGENVKSDYNSPFVQAKNGMFAIRDYLKAQGDITDSFETILMGFGVMFPDISFNIPEELEYDVETIFDDHNYRKVADYIRSLSDFYQKKLKSKHVYYHLPTKPEIKSIVNILRSDFDFKISFLSGMNTTQGIQKRLTDQQYMIIEANEDNDRNLIVGLAGTGKTVLAWETARYYKSEGLKVGFFCFNKNLAEYLNYFMNGNSHNEKLDYLGTLHSYMAKNSSYLIHEQQNDSFFYEVLPTEFVSKKMEESEKFDVLVVDEIQDLLLPNYLKAFDYMLKDGLGNGKWYFFGDLSMQCLYSEGKSGSELIEYLEEWCDQYSKSTLRLNCRNTCQIHEEVSTLFSIDSKYWKKDIRNIGPDVEQILCEDNSDGNDEIKNLINRLINEEQIPCSQITLLSFRRFENSSFYRLKDKFDISLDSVNDAYMKFSTVYGYKGLENSIIILADYDKSVEDSLLYVALTRASYKIYWCMSLDSMQAYYRLYRGSLE